MGNTYLVEIEEELKRSYLNYAMSVIVSRAIPDVRDGLKPVHRRILYAMDEMGLSSNKPYKKCGRIVGDVLGKYHPHGDAAIYETLVRMAQDFSLRYPAIDGHGNFGSIDDDPPAAMRYTEARLSKLAELMLKDIDKETIDFVPNYDDSLKEPMVLPSAVPYLLINGTSGIAVGMATNIPPYNIREIVTAITKTIDNPDISIDELSKIISGPDFPTGGVIFGREGIKKALATGKGQITIRAKVYIEEIKKEKEAIIVKELPYQVCKAKLIEYIASLVKEDKIQGISDIRDESDREGMRIVIEIKKGAIPKVILNQLFNHTSLQVNYSINNLVLDKGIPKTLNIKQTIQAYIDFRKEIIYRRTKFELKKAQDRAHIVLGLLIAIDNIDEVIKIIKNAKDTDEAKNNLINKFNLTELQANAIVEMRLRQLTNLESFKLKEEYDQLLKTIERLKEILSSDFNVLQVVKNELVKDCEPFFDNRKTEIIEKEAENFEIEDLIQNELMVVTITHRGFIKRILLKEFKSQGRGGGGVSSASLRDDDFVENLFVANTHDYVLFFSNKGLVYKIKVYEIPQLSKAAKGETIKTLIGISPNEEITAVLNVSDFNNNNQNIFIATRKGIVKKVSISEFSNVKSSGKKAIILDDNDSVVDVKITDGKPLLLKQIEKSKFESMFLSDNKDIEDDNNYNLTNEDKTFIMSQYELNIEENKYKIKENISNEDKEKVIEILKKIGYGNDIILGTRKGKALRMNEKFVRVMGRNTRGVTGIKLEKDDELCGLCVVDEDSYLLLMTEYGYGKKIDPDLFSLHGRGTAGQRYYKYSEEKGEVVSIKQVKSTDNIVAITSRGNLIRINTDEISQQGRNTTGIRLVKIQKPDFVVSIAISPNEE